MRFLSPQRGEGWGEGRIRKAPPVFLQKTGF
jgi:hypothetical protein